MTDLNLLYEAILKGKQKDAVALTEAAIAENIAPKTLIEDYMIKALAARPLNLTHSENMRAFSEALCE